MAVLLLAGAPAADLLACGDKYLVPGRGTRFQRSPGERQASTVLVYAPPGSTLASTLARLNVESAVRKAGYRPTVATTSADLTRAAATRWDVVVVSPSDGGAVRDRLAEPSLAHLIAVAPPVTAIELKQMRSSYPIVLKTPGRNQDFLDAIDDAAGCARLDQRKTAKSR
jgi:hypothetical protein